MERKRKNSIRIALIIIASLCIVLGVKRGDLQDVYKKASKICFECIGIG